MNGLLNIQYNSNNTTNSPRRLEGRKTLGSQKNQGVALEMTAGTTNPVSTEHGDITAAAAAIFASANANSWPIGKHQAYGMGYICWWRKGDKGAHFWGICREG